MSDAVEPYSFSLGTFDEPPSVNLLIDITAAEYEAIDGALAAFAGLSASFDYKLVERNFLDLESIHQFVTITISLGQQFAAPDHRQLGEALMGSTVNWLTSMRLFLDHNETALKRRFGKVSPEAQRFKTATSSAFDTKVGYRFSYRFRNYVQHCGLPLSHIEINPPNPAARTRVKQSVALLLDRDVLLRNYDEWGSIVKRDLQAMPPRFPLFPLVSQTMEGLRDVYRELLDIRLSEALRRCTVLERALTRIEDTGASGHPAVFRHRGVSSRRGEFTPQLLPAEAIRQLARVADGSASRESLLKESEERPPPMFDPATIRERFHRDNRGVQVLSARLAEKGGSPAFVDAVNAVIAQDQSVEPLITGLINVSTLLAHMAAAALGATAEGLVAGLLDVYGQLDKPPDGESTA